MNKFVYEVAFVNIGHVRDARHMKSGFMYIAVNQAVGVYMDCKGVYDVFSVSGFHIRH